MQYPLSSTFRSALSQPHRDRYPASLELEEQLRVDLARCHTAWPSIEIGAELYLRYWAERLPQFAAPHLPELYLACACASGHSGALALFDADYLARLPVELRYLRAPHSVVDDVVQSLRVRLLTSMGAARPRISHYAGRGPLRTWVRIAAVRATLRHMRQRQRHVSVDALASLAARATDSDPELAHLQSTYQRACKQSLDQALSSLTTRQRDLLRAQICHGQTLDTLAARHGVHRATIARWLAQARAELRRRTLRILQREHAIRGVELAGILDSRQLQISL